MNRVCKQYVDKVDNGFHHSDNNSLVLKSVSSKYKISDHVARKLKVHK